MIYKLRKYISDKLRDLSLYICPLPTLEEVLGEAVDEVLFTYNEDDDEIEW